MIQEIFSPSQAAFRATEDFFAVHESEESESTLKQASKIASKVLTDGLIAIAAIVETVFFAILIGAFSLFYLFSPEHFEALKERTFAAATTFKEASIRIFTSPKIIKKTAPAPETESPQSSSKELKVDNFSECMIEQTEPKTAKTWPEIFTEIKDQAPKIFGPAIVLSAAAILGIATYYLGIKNQFMVNYFTKKG